MSSIRPLIEWHTTFRQQRIASAHKKKSSEANRYSRHLSSIFIVDYRDSTIRKKRWPPELDQKIKNAFNVIKTETEGVQYLMKLGLTAHEIDLVLQHFFRNKAMVSAAVRKDLDAKNCNLPRSAIPYARAPLSPQEQQLKLIAFSKNVSVEWGGWLYVMHAKIAFRQVIFIFVVQWNRIEWLYLSNVIAALIGTKIEHNLFFDD